MIIFNLPGIIMLLLAYGIAFGIGHLVGFSAEGWLMIVAGPLATMMDLVYRSKRSGQNWFHPAAGGNLFFIPVWIFGILWTFVGVFYVIRGHS